MKNKKKFFLFSAFSLFPIVIPSIAIGFSACSSTNTSLQNSNDIILNYYQFFDFQFKDFQKMIASKPKYAKSIICQRIDFLNENNTKNSKIYTASNQIILTNVLLDGVEKNIIIENKNIFDEKNNFDSNLINNNIKNQAFDLFNSSFNEQIKKINLNYEKEITNPQQPPSFVQIPIPFKVVFNTALENKKCFQNFKEQIKTQIQNNLSLVSQDKRLEELFNNDIDFIFYDYLVKCFDQWKTNVFKSNLYYAKNITFSHIDALSNYSINGDIYLQFKNCTDTVQQINFLNINETLNSNDFITFDIKFNNSKLDLSIFNVNNKSTVGFNVSGSKVYYQINKEQQKQVNFEIPESNTISSIVENIAVKNNIYDDKQEIVNLITNLTNSTGFIINFKNNFLQSLQDDFNVLKEQIISIIQILEILNNDHLTLKQFLQSLGNPLYTFVKKFNVNLAVILKNLFSPQSVSSFLYNSFDNIMLFIDSIKNDQNRDLLTSVQNFLKENFENKPESAYISFIENIQSLKETIEIFLMGANIFNPEQLSSILQIVDELSKNDNIFVFLVNNLNKILDIVSTLFPDTSLQFELVNNINNWINSFTPNILEQDFWNLLLTKNLKYEAIIATVKKINPTIGDILDGLYVLFTKKPNSKQLILNFLTSILGSSTSTNNSIKPVFEDTTINSLSQYIQNHFIFEPDNINSQLTLSNDWLISGQLNYDFKFNSKATFNLQPLKDLINSPASTTPPPVPVKQQSTIFEIISNLDVILSKLINQKATSVIISNNVNKPTTIKNSIKLLNNSLLPLFKNNNLYLSIPYTLEQDFSLVWSDLLVFLNPIIKPFLPKTITTNLNYCSNIKLSNKYYDVFDTNLINFENQINIDQMLMDNLILLKKQIWDLFTTNKTKQLVLNYYKLQQGIVEQIDVDNRINYLDPILICDKKQGLTKKIKFTIKSPINILINDQVSQNKSINFINEWSTEIKV